MPSRRLALAGLAAAALLNAACSGGSTPAASPPVAVATSTAARATEAPAASTSAATAIATAEAAAVASAATAAVPATQAVTASPAATGASAPATPAGTAPPAATASPDPTAAPVAVAATGCLSTPNPVLTTPYTDLKLIDFINPTIVTSGNWLKNRQYHKVVTDSANNAPEAPIYAPSDAVAFGVTHYIAPMLLWDGSTIEISQYEVRFELSCEVSYWFDHLSRLVEPFASLAPVEGVRDTRNAMVPIRVEVKAGDLIGYSTGTEPAHVWDFVLVDASRTAKFANQQRYEQTGDLQHLLHSACPTDYFSPELRSSYSALYGSWQGRQTGFACDTTVDVPGTIAGGWFVSPFDGSDPFAPADWGVVVKAAADGFIDVNGPGRSLRTGPLSPTFADPKTVTGEHCYQHYSSPARFAYLKVLPGDQLAVAFGDGSCPSALPASYEVYYR